tara:strand:- start:40608 stop:41051 length:444 start_codon:yes stop_codon:yes gene_type:complete
MPYAIIKVSDESIVREFPSIPKAFQIGNRRIVAPVSVGNEGIIDGETYRFVELVRVGWNRPGPYYTQGTDTPILTSTSMTITRQWTVWTQQEIDDYLAAQDVTEVNEIMDQRTTRALFAIVNEIRVLKSQPELSKAQFRTWFEGLAE